MRLLLRQLKNVSLYTFALIKKVDSLPPDIEPKHMTATKDQLFVKMPNLQAKKNWTRTAIIPCTCPRHQMMFGLTEKIHDERLLRDLRVSDMKRH